MTRRRFLIFSLLLSSGCANFLKRKGDSQTASTFLDLKSSLAEAQVKTSVLPIDTTEISDQAMAQDFANDRFAIVHGWLLSSTEIQLLKQTLE